MIISESQSHGINPLGLIAMITDTHNRKIIYTIFCHNCFSILHDAQDEVLKMLKLLIIHLMIILNFLSLINKMLTLEVLQHKMPTPHS